MHGVLVFMAPDVGYRAPEVEQQVFCGLNTLRSAPGSCCQSSDGAERE